MTHHFTSQHLLFIVLAFRWTVVLSLLAFLGGGVLGAPVALAERSSHAAVKACSRVFVEVFQGTPLLMQLFTIYFGLPLLGLEIGAWTSVLLALTLNSAAFLGEIWRGALASVPVGQIEAARSLGLRPWPVLRLVVAPQALRVAVAPTVGFMVQIIKGTSLAALVNFVEVMRAGQMVNNVTFRPDIVFAVVAALYFLACWPLSLASRALERRLGAAEIRVSTAV